MLQVKRIQILDNEKLSDKMDIVFFSDDVKFFGLSKFWIKEILRSHIQILDKTF